MSVRDQLFSIISDMEDDVADVARWGEVVRLLGTVSCNIDPGVLWVIGKPLTELGERIDAKWNRAHQAAGGQP
ncbi:hypothetical protein MKL09_31460 [Methylobacterium sp. J-048]|uniref:hypothetical protein n=1 Tax=Methylobacterium sp. J-048 TaxID=2836635 RepID=UPI001FBAF59E|nr:hypothetical protein [Methylobacterium sp. J-048]MCJ2061024.1 hypothetical protein [Methylobacterium sp. J-048]